MSRIKTYFGVHIPPFKEEKIGAGSTTIRFVIKGKVVSKKNNTMTVSVKKDAKNFILNTFSKSKKLSVNDAFKAIDLVRSKFVGNKEYYSFLKKQLPEMEAQKQFWIERLGKKGLEFPLKKASMTLKLFFKDKYVTDTVNKQQTIQDLLVEAGIIENDDYRTINPIHSAACCYYRELLHNISFVSLSFKM